MSSSALTGPLLSDVSRSADGAEAAPSWSFQNSPTMGFYRVSANVLGLSTAGVQRMVVDASGNVGIGTGSPAVKLEVNGSIRMPASTGFQLGNGSTYFYTTATSNGDFVFGTSSSDRARIDASGNLLVGTSSVIGVGALCNFLGGGNVLHVRSTGSGANNIVSYDSAGTARFSVSNGGVVSKTSGSFKIDHPLKPDTHHLVHSFVEAPQADNIYRGKVVLSAGQATVNIDEIAGMTEGTFTALNREVQCFTSNESDWDAVRGSINGNLLTIECQNPQSTATISWLVIGERQDKHMYDTDWTDENGKVIVEPIKGESAADKVE